ncbi:MAG TPA: helix-turn-helix domain-containing protein [Burkholderiaceae bacterium]|nr:helix-turn-helix domain-containing protein [Burkholderiaceae bacterium]
METINRTEISESTAVKSLAALAQAQRLRAFRALVVAGSDGLTPGAMAERLDIAASALSFHLKELVHSGLASCEPRGRYLIYRANFDHMTALLAYLTEHCCQGQNCAVTDLNACQTC